MVERREFRDLPVVRPKNRFRHRVDDQHIRHPVPLTRTHGLQPIRRAALRNDDQLGSKLVETLIEWIRWRKLESLRQKPVRQPRDG